MRSWIPFYAFSPNRNRYLLSHHLRRICSHFGFFMICYRSLFVPYFKYILNGLVRHLTDEVTRPGPTPKTKKAKLMDPELNNKSQEEHSSLSVGKWHVRALVLSSLHKCFLYDTGNLEFLDSSNFQVSILPFYCPFLYYALVVKYG